MDQSKLSPIQRMYIRRVERLNKGRVSVEKVKKSRVRYVGLFFLGSATAIYLYTMVAMKQEKLGDEYDQRITDISPQNDR